MASRAVKSRSLAPVSALAWCLVASFLAGCGSHGGSSSSASDSSAGSGAIVEVVRGPIQPVQQQGMDNTAPVSGAEVTIRDSSGQAVASDATGGDGKASFALAPARYEIEVTTCPGAMSLPPARAVTVSDGSFTAVRMQCDTGIR